MWYINLMVEGKQKVFSVLPNLLPKSDPRYQKWKKSLEKRPPSWVIGKNKDNDSRVTKISNTMKRKHLDNFKGWRDKMIKLGKIRHTYPPFEKSGELAFLIGMVIGDGNIYVFPRTECLDITFSGKYPKMVDYTEKIVLRLFEKKFSHTIRNGPNGGCIRGRIYQKQISSRLGVPSGKRRYTKIGVPNWIWQKRKYLTACLRGLFEAEGSYSVHLPTCTYNFQFSNRNVKILDDVERGLKILGYRPERRINSVRLRKRAEAMDFKKLINFREF